MLVRARAREKTPRGPARAIARGRDLGVARPAIADLICGPTLGLKIWPQNTSVNAPARRVHCPDDPDGPEPHFTVSKSCTRAVLQTPQ